MDVMIRSATPDDASTLVALMTAFYAEADFPLPSGPATRAFETLLADARLGGAWLAERAGNAVGHVVLTVCFSEVRALHVEVGPENSIARRLYARAGYVERRASAPQSPARTASPRHLKDCADCTKQRRASSMRPRRRS